MKINFGIIIEARTESRRLPNKVLKKFQNKTVLEHIILRCKRVEKNNKIIIATTIKESDLEIEKIAKNNKVLLFRGSENDVMGRVLNAAVINDIDVIIEITGDNPLVDPKMIDEVITEFLKYRGKYEYYANDINKNIPIGLNVRLFTTKFLSKIEKLTDHPVDREHVVNYVMQRKQLFKIKEVKSKINLNKYKKYRLTMDTIEDYELINKIYDGLYSQNNNFTTVDVLKYIENNICVLDINKDVRQLEYKY
jgi:spore coat polysaccharide biosynthesis protein SpsF